jgi:hypothetical protein
MRGAVRVAQVAGLAALLWATASEHRSDGTHRVPVVLLVVAGGVGVVGQHPVGAPRRVTWLALAVLAGAGERSAGCSWGTRSSRRGSPGDAGRRGTHGGDRRDRSGVLDHDRAGRRQPARHHRREPAQIVAAVLGGASRRQYQIVPRRPNSCSPNASGPTKCDRAAALAERNRVGREVQ